MGAEELLSVKPVVCKLVGGLSCFSVDPARPVMSILKSGVFQERHAAEVRRNKELQVELSG